MVRKSKLPGLVQRSISELGYRCRQGIHYKFYVYLFVFVSVVVVVVFN